jgi:lysophospholipase L1-like esterase
MNYQNILCLGDSQTYGARTYGCYPLHLAKILTDRTAYEWRAINRSVNGYTARDLWFLVNENIDSIHDTFQCCLLIGANDVSKKTSLPLFEEYYRQILRSLRIKKYKAIYCGEIPPIHADGHVFFERASTDLRLEYNEVIRKLTEEVKEARFVVMRELPRSFYEDPVHFNEQGNVEVAESFAEVLVAR